MSVVLTYPAMGYECRAALVILDTRGWMLPVIALPAASLLSFAM